MDNQVEDEEERQTFLDFLRLLNRMADLANLPKIAKEFDQDSQINLDTMVLGTNISLYTNINLYTAKALSEKELEIMLADAREVMRQAGLTQESRDLIWGYFLEAFNCYMRLKTEGAVKVASQLFRIALTSPREYLFWEHGNVWETMIFADILTACKSRINSCNQTTIRVSSDKQSRWGEIRKRLPGEAA